MCARGRDARPSPAAGMQAGGREVFLWDGARCSGNTCKMLWQLGPAVPIAHTELSPPCKATGVPACLENALLAWVRVMAPLEPAALLPLGLQPHTLACSGPQGHRCFLAGVSEFWGLQLLFAQLDRGVGPLLHNSGLLWLGGGVRSQHLDEWSPPVPGNSWLQGLCLHHHCSLLARPSWDGSQSPPGASVPLAAATTFLQCVPPARVLRLPPALACVVPPDRGSCSGGERG